MRDFWRKFLKNLAVFLLALIGIKDLLTALPMRFTFEFSHLYGLSDQAPILVFHGVLSFLVGTLMLFLTFGLYRRVRNAWLVEIIALVASIVLQFFRYHRFTIPIIIIEVFVLVILSITYRDFSRKADKVSVKRSFFFIGISFFLLLGNASVGLFIMQPHIRDVHTIINAFYGSIKLLITMDISALQYKTSFGRIYADSLIALNWICILTSALLLLKPFVYDPFKNRIDRGKARNIVLKYGQNPSSYLALENDKKIFFGVSVEGVCAYTIVGNVFVCCGDIICSETDGFIFLSEIHEYCKSNGLDILLMNVTECFLSLYQSAQFGIVKLGEDACFKLNEHNLSGGKIAKVRAAVNHARKAGITIHEYRPLHTRDTDIEHSIKMISSAWLSNKNSPEMTFMLGSVSLENPMDRRYFYAKEPSGKILGFIVFLPYMNQKGWYADVTRRYPGSGQGIMETILIDAFDTFRQEGAEWANLGLCPLYNVAAGDKATFSERLFSFIYENMNESYDFKALFHAKEKYAPTHWETRYLAFHPKPFSAQFAYAIVKSQNPKGIVPLLFNRSKTNDRAVNIKSSPKTERDSTNE